jgi:hypothetical protein
MGIVLLILIAVSTIMLGDGRVGHRGPTSDVGIKLVTELGDREDANDPVIQLGDRLVLAASSWDPVGDRSLSAPARYPSHGSMPAGEPVAASYAKSSALLAQESPVVVNQFVNLATMPSTSFFSPNAMGCPANFIGTFRFEGRLTNTSDRELSHLVLVVTTLSNGNLLQNADEGPGGVGAHMTVPRANGFIDGILSPQEFVDVTFSICLRERSRFNFFVNVFGQPDMSTTQIILPYNSPGYSFLVVPFGQGTGFERPDFDDSHFAPATAAFGTPDYCPLDPTVQTAWPLETDILLRHLFTLPADASSVRVAVAIDNDVQVFINGVDVSDGLQQNEGCAELDHFVFLVPDDVLIFGGENLLAVRARDRGVISYIDLEVRANTPVL